jgi:hypothetical protein
MELNQRAMISEYKYPRTELLRREGMIGKVIS